jgi:tetratricopeptide (TPR) repeat protein
MFYGICFDYDKYAYEFIKNNQNYYTSLGIREWYMAGTWKNNPSQIVLYYPVARGQHTDFFNGVYMKAISSRTVQNHGNRPMNHAWLWVIGNDGTTYWIDPTLTDGFGYIVWGVVQNGREEQAAPNVRLCAIRPPSSTAFVPLSRGDANRTEGKYEEAVKDYDEVIRVEPNYALAYNNRGLANYHKGNYDQAIADFNEALRLNPNYADAYNNRGLAYYAKGDLDKALADYNQAITHDDGLALAYNGRAYVYLAKKDHRQAVTDVAQAIKRYAGEATWYATLGEIYLDLQRYDAAISAFDQALGLSPGFTRARELRQRARRRGR